MKKLMLLPALFACSLCYGATGNASDGDVFILVIILALLAPLAISYLVKFIREKISEFIIHQKRCR
jgi:hypothetical protein